jgi:hypothetical protein
MGRGAVDGLVGPCRGAPGRGGASAAETLLARAVVLAAMRDLRSTRAPIRAEAEAWVQDLAALTLWAEVLGVAPEVLQQALARAARQG